MLIWGDVYCYSLLRLLLGQDKHHLLELMRPEYFICNYNRLSFSRHSKEETLILFLFPDIRLARVLE
jgi:hypothetical protein